MILHRRALNESGVAHLLLLAVVVVVAIGGVGVLVAVRQSKSHNDSKAGTQTPTSQQATKTDQSTQKTEATPVTQTTNTTTPAPTSSQTQPAPKPAAAKITHPTDANCPADGKTITVYASVSGGTPVYKQNYAAPELLAKKLDYGTSVAVSCYNGWVTYRVGDQPYYMSYADVSVTKP